MKVTKKIKLCTKTLLHGVWHSVTAALRILNSTSEERGLLASCAERFDDDTYFTMHKLRPWTWLRRQKSLPLLRALSMFCSKYYLLNCLDYQNIHKTACG